MTTAIDGGFQFVEMDPDLGIRVEAQRVFDELANLAPYGANFEASILKKPEGYLVELNVLSSIGHFRASVERPECETALLQLEHIMQRKFETWRHERFGPAVHEVKDVA